MMKPCTLSCPNRMHKHQAMQLSYATAGHICAVLHVC
jgi:hypothetical protein